MGHTRDTRDNKSLLIQAICNLTLEARCSTAAMQRLPPLAVPSQLFSSATNERRFSGEQFEPYSGLTRPQPAGRGYVSIFAGGAPGDRVEWPVFGEQIDDLTAATRPEAANRD